MPERTDQQEGLLKKAEVFEATLVRRNRLSGLVGLAGLATTLVALIAVLTHVGADVLGFGFYGAYAALMALTIHFTWMRPDESRAALRVDARDSLSERHWLGEPER